mmetsp:Transcript_1018/g.1200  ORF Transcript_1018/g.1200 Transcript_1018/m.1200 type:complete len:441 (+) Transcript_1018:60-1382(+)
MSAGSRDICHRKISLPIIRPVWVLLLIAFFCAIQNVLFFVVVNNDEPLQISNLPIVPHPQHTRVRRRKLVNGTRVTPQLAKLNDETNVAIPTRYDSNKEQEHTSLSIEERLRYLELKLNAGLNWGVKNPFFGLEVAPDARPCRQQSNLEEFGCTNGWDWLEPYDAKNHPRWCAGLFDHTICLDDLPPPLKKLSGGTYRYADPKKRQKCLVYDFGIREQPQFGVVMAKTFGCEVHAFDPSPISLSWWNSNDTLVQSLRAMGNYHFHPYGAGGIDGNIQLLEYNWKQVSVLRLPRNVVNSSDCDESTCRIVNHDIQQRFELPVKTLPTIMQELNHTSREITILKLDVEGSEYAFLEQVLDSSGGCPQFIRQMTLEWHHYSFDWRYGEGSSAGINVIATLLHTCGLKNFWTYDEAGQPNNEKIYTELGMKDVRYNLASFRRDG